MTQRRRSIRACVSLTCMTISWLSLVPMAWGGLHEGLAAYDRDDYATAYRELLPLAQRGDAIAQCVLGIMYQSGEGVAQDDAKAVWWYRKAAEQGNADAQSALGLMYATGHGVLQDNAKAMQWYRNAAEQGN